VEASKLAGDLSIEDVDVVLANLDRKAITYTADGKPANLAEVLGAAADRLSAAVGGSRNLSSGLPTNPEGPEISTARTLAEFPRIGTPGLFKK
jgi:hypothetical protein